MATGSVVYESNKVRKIISVKNKSYQRKIAERNKWLEIQIIVKKKKKKQNKQQRRMFHFPRELTFPLRNVS